MDKVVIRHEKHPEEPRTCQRRQHHEKYPRSFRPEPDEADTCAQQEYDAELTKDLKATDKDERRPQNHPMLVVGHKVDSLFDLIDGQLSGVILGNPCPVTD